MLNNSTKQTGHDSLGRRNGHQVSRLKPGAVASTRHEGKEVIFSCSAAAYGVHSPLKFHASSTILVSLPRLKLSINEISKISFIELESQGTDAH